MRLALLTSCVLISACGCGSDRYTLYRNSVLDSQVRYHVASFDASDGANYNNEN